VRGCPCCCVPLGRLQSYASSAASASLRTHRRRSGLPCSLSARPRVPYDSWRARSVGFCCPVLRQRASRVGCVVARLDACFALGKHPGAANRLLVVGRSIPGRADSFLSTSFSAKRARRTYIARRLGRANQGRRGTSEAAACGYR